MKKHLSILLSFVLCIGIFVACDNGGSSETESETTSNSVTTESENTAESVTAENTENNETTGESETTETAATTGTTVENTSESTESIETDDTQETTTETSESSHPAGNSLAKFEFGDNGEAKHYDGSEMKDSSASYTENGYTLKFTSFSKVYVKAKDAVGTSVLKIGTSSVVGSFEFVVGDNVNSVLLKIAKYKDHDTVININGTEYTLTKNSNDGEYDIITIDTSTNKKITFESVKTGKRCMIDSIEFKG